MTISMKPLLMGAAMGGMMLWMMHQVLTSDSQIAGYALAMFVGVHLLIGALVIGAGLWAARLSPRVRALMSKLHRPSLSHVVTMALGGLGLAAAIHVSFHGVF